MKIQGTVLQCHKGPNQQHHRTSCLSSSCSSNQWHLQCKLYNLVCNTFLLLNLSSGHLLNSKFLRINSVAVGSISFATRVFNDSISFMYLTERRPVAERASRTLIPSNSHFPLALTSSALILAYSLIVRMLMSLLNSYTGL